MKKVRSYIKKVMAVLMISTLLTGLIGSAAHAETIQTTTVNTVDVRIEMASANWNLHEVYMTCPGGCGYIVESMRTWTWELAAYRGSARLGTLATIGTTKGDQCQHVGCYVQYGVTAITNPTITIPASKLQSMNLHLDSAAALSGVPETRNLTIKLNTDMRMVLMGGHNSRALRVTGGNAVVTRGTAPAENHSIGGVTTKYNYSRIPFAIVCDVYNTSTTNQYKNPTVTNHPDAVVSLGDSVNWTDGITATWGETVANTIPSMGAITDDSLDMSGTDTDLSTTGTTYDRVGWKQHSYTIKDDHSLSTVAPYIGDNTSATTTRNIIVQAINAPALAIKYGAAAVDESGASITGNAYAGEWTNQPLDITASSTDLGAYDTSIWQNGAAMSPVEATTGNSHSLSGYQNESATAAGDDFSAILLGTGNHSLKLSPKSTDQTVKIDVTAPTLTTVTPQQTAGNDDWSKLPGTDAADGLSGLETATGGLYYKFVPHSSSAPAIDHTWNDDYDAAYGALTPADYDLYVYAKDNATNKSGAILANTSKEIRVLSQKSPVLTGSTSSITNLASGTWSNENVTVLAKNPADVDTPPAVLSPHYVDYTDSGDGLVTPTIAAHHDRAATTTGTVNHTYTEETDGIDITGILVNGSGVALTNPSSYTVKIDKTAPTAVGALTYVSDNHYTLADNGSHDNNTTSNGAGGSGVDSGSLRFAVVPSGNLAPTSYLAYDKMPGINQDFSSLGAGSYDVYAMVKDNAGNISGAAPVLGQIVIKNTNSSIQPNIIGTYSTATTDRDNAAIAANSSYTSGTWSNTAIDLTGQKGSGTYSGLHNVDLLNAGTPVAAGTGNAGADVAYQAATEGKSTYNSVVVNTAMPKAELSNQSANFEVWLDTKAPITAISSGDSWVSNTDASADDTSLTPNVSGVYKTYLNFVPAGTLGVNYSTAGWKDAAGASLTKTGTWDIYAYTIDNAGNKSAVQLAGSNVVVASTITPVLTATYSAGATDKDGNSVAGTAYDGSWTNDAVDLKLTTTDLASGLYGVLYQGGILLNNGAMISRQYVSGNYNTESTGSAGTNLTGKVAANASLTGLSPASSTLNVKIDTVTPVTSITANAGNKTFTDASSDDKSGIYKTMIAYVPEGAAAPAAGAYEDITTAVVSGIGNFDIYAYSIDHAGNRSTAALQTTVVTTSTIAPILEIKYGAGATDKDGNVIAGQNYAGDWTKAPLDITVKTTETGNLKGIIQKDAVKKSGGALSSGAYTLTGYHDETGIAQIPTGNLITGVMTTNDPAETAVTPATAARGVKIDTVAPTTSISVNAGNTTFTDTSTDDKSGVYKTMLAYVPTGSSAPAAGAYAEISTVNITTAGQYDIWAYTIDQAGNRSSAVQTQTAIPVASTHTPILSAVYSSGATDKDGNAVAGTAYDGSWTNDAVDVKLQTTDLAAGLYGVLYSGGTQFANGALIGQQYISTGYSNESATNAGTDLTGRTAVDAALTGLSPVSAALNVKIDKTAPVTSIAANVGNATFSDASTDDKSGVYKTMVAFVTTGAPAPAASAYADITTAAITGAGTYDVYAYTRDHAGNDSAKAKQMTVTVTSTNVPTLGIKYGAGAFDKDGNSVTGQTYTGDWTNAALDIKVSTTDSGSLKGIIRKDNTRRDGGTITGGAYTLSGYPDETGLGEVTTGNKITAIITTNDLAESPVSPESLAQYVKIDTVAPTTAITANAGNTTFYDASTDDKSGVYKTMIAYVAKNAMAPAAGAYEDITTAVITTPGEYDIWAYTIDQAGNKSAAAKMLSGIQVVSSAQAELKATYNDNGTIKNYTPGTWINKDIILTASKPGGFNYNGNYNSAVYYNSTAQLGKGSDNQGGDYVFTSSSSVFDETVFALLVDGNNDPVSAASGSIQVKVDQVAPVPVAKVAPGTYEILDQSTDVHSGVDHSKTKIAMVPHNAAPPAASDFTLLSGDSVPSDGNYYDIYMLVTDYAGNTSTIMEVLGNRSTNPKDDITASNFERGLNEGTLSDMDARLLSDVAGNYYTITLPKLPIAQNDIAVDGSMLGSINGQITSGILGTYDLQFTTPTLSPPRPAVSLNPAYSEQADIKVKLYQYGSGLPGTEKIYGNDFAYAVKNGTLDDARAKNLATVFARESDLSVMNLASVTVDPLQLAAINAAVAAKDVDHNTWPLTFETPAGVAVTVQVSLFDNVTPDPVTPGEEMIAANDFAFGMDQGALPDNMAKFLSNVMAKDDAGNAIATSGITVDTGELAVINAAIAAGDKSGNPFDLSFETPGGKRVTVKVTLFDYSNPPATGQALIVGDDFCYAIPNGTINNSLAKELAKVSAKDGLGIKIDVSTIGVDPIELAAINASITAGIKTTLPLTFTEPSGEQVTVQVTLYQNGPVPPTPNEEEIFADDFSYGISSGLISADAAKILSQVYAHYANGADVNRNDITVDVAELAAINAKIAAGDKSGNPFPLTFRSPGGKQTTVQVTLKDRGPVTPPVKGREYITGNDFFYGMNQGPLSDVNAKFLGQIDPRNADGSAMNPASVMVDSGELTAINTAISSGDKTGNPFALTYTTPDGTSATVNVTLYDRSNPPAVNRALIVGNDFSYGINQGTMTDDIAKIYGRVKAVDGNANPINPVNISVDPVQLGAINTAIAAGNQSSNPFPLTFTEPSGESVTILVTLKDRGAGPGPGVVPQQDAITANDFIYGINEGALTDTVSKFRSQVTGVDRNGNPYALSALTTDATQLTVINSAIAAGQVGSYPLTYTTPDGTSVTIQVALRDQATSPTPDPSDPSKPGSGNIGANDFIVSANNPTPLSDQDARDEAQAIAKDKFGTDFPTASINVDATELAAINSAKAAGTIGDYPLTFTSPEGKSVTVTVSLRAVHTITVNYVDRQGNPVRASETETITQGTTYTKTAPAIAEKVFVDWSKNAANPMANLEGNITVSIPNVISDMTLTLVYGQDKGGSGPDGKTPDGIEDFTITEQYIGNGTVIAGNTERYINRGTAYLGSPLNIGGYSYTGYQVDGGAFLSGANPTIANVQHAHTVTMHYAVVTNPTPPAKPNKPGDNGNYNFIKKPNVKNVAAGQTVNYTFAEFGNKWGVPLDKYTISDRPDKGLDFVSAKLPAFKNGAGVTYDVVYYTNKMGRTTLYSDIPADKAFTAKAPQLSKGEYITGVSIVFGKVPAGFAVGDTMQMSFKVWDNPPAKVLMNEGLLSYRVNGKDMKFVSSGAGASITIGGWFDAPKTGDEPLWMFCSMIALAAVMAAISKNRRKQYKRD